MQLTKNIIARYGEYQAAQYLIHHGYSIQTINSYDHWSEIDIIAEKNNILIFIEVKTRISLTFGIPEESWTRAKARKMLRGIYQFLERHQKQDALWRVDFISVMIERDRTKLAHYACVEME